MADGCASVADGGEKDSVPWKPEESTHLAMGRLEDFPEAVSSGSCRMNRTWPGRKAGTRVGVAGMPSDLGDSKCPFRSEGGMGVYAAATVGNFSPQATLPVASASSFRSHLTEP